MLRQLQKHAPHVGARAREVVSRVVERQVVHLVHLVARVVEAYRVEVVQLAQIPQLDRRVLAACKFIKIAIIGINSFHKSRERTCSEVVAVLGEGESRHRTLAAGELAHRRLVLHVPDANCRFFVACAQDETVGVESSARQYCKIDRLISSKH